MINPSPVHCVPAFAWHSVPKLLLLLDIHDTTGVRRILNMQDKLHLYFLFDLMPGGDLMDVLVAEARVIKRRIAQGTWKRACFAPKVHRPATWHQHAPENTPVT